MSALPQIIHSVAQVRAMEAYAITQLKIPGYVLMTRAAEAALVALRGEWPRVARLIIVCGAGNNAGDGYVLARLAMGSRLAVHVMAVGEPTALQGDAAQAWREFVAAGGVTHPFEPSVLAHAQPDDDVVVDALLGIGLSRPLDDIYLHCVQAINAAPAPVFALDVPTGLNADTGAVMGAVVRAHRTITFIGLKQGFYLGAGPNYLGKLLFDDLELPTAVAAQVAHVAQRMDSRLVQQALPRRSRTTHKGQQGQVVIIGGGLGMPGAVRLCGEACLRVGAGLVTVLTRPEHAASVVASRPELMCCGVLTAADMQAHLQRADVIAIGPGLGQDAWARAMLAAVLATDKPLVVDADALNLLAHQPVRREHWVLTPHPGEAARLLSSSTAMIQVRRMQALNELLQQYGGTVVLKGAGTLVGSLASNDTNKSEAPDAQALMNTSLATAMATPMICDRGNPGMAAPGMGDVLTGIIAGIAAQQPEVAQGLALAARAGVYVHAVAGDMAARHGERGILASDLFGHLQSCVNP